MDIIGSEKKYKVSSENLKDGDIILTGSDGLISRFIKKVTKGKFSHAILYANGVGIEAKPSCGIYPCNVSRLSVKRSEDIKVLRLKSGLSDDGAIKISNIAHATSGVVYSYLTTLRTISKYPNHPRFDSRLYCSKYVARCYELAGVHLNLNGIEVSPVDLSKCDSFYEVPQHQYLVETNLSPFDVIKDSQGKDMTKVMGKRLLKIYKKVKILSDDDGYELFKIDLNNPKVPLNMIEDYVSLFPYRGAKVLEIIKNNNYFSGFKEDSEIYPYRYDVKKFKEKYLEVDCKNEFYYSEIKAIRDIYKSNFINFIRVSNLLKHNRKNPFFKEEKKFYKDSLGLLSQWAHGLKNCNHESSLIDDVIIIDNWANFFKKNKKYQADQEYLVSKLGVDERGLEFLLGK